MPSFMLIGPKLWSGEGFLYITRVAQSLSGEAQCYLPQVTPRVSRSVHAKFHADRTKTVVRSRLEPNWRIGNV